MAWLTVLICSGLVVAHCKTDPKSDVSGPHISDGGTQKRSEWPTLKIQPSKRSAQQEEGEQQQCDMAQVCQHGLPGPPGSQGIQGIQGVQGPAGAPGLPGVSGRKGEKGGRGRRGRKGEVDLSGLPRATPKIAFSATTEEDVLVHSEYRILKFPLVLSNTGGCYDSQTGMFSSAFNASYLIGFGGVSSHGQNVLLHLIKNGKRMLSAFSGSGCQCCISDINVKKAECAGAAHNVAILNLCVGDKVWVQLPDQYGLHNDLFHNYASFYGHLLFEF